jgi:hypothetical protein
MTILLGSDKSVYCVGMRTSSRRGRTVGSGLLVSLLCSSSHHHFFTIATFTASSERLNLFPCLTFRESMSLFCVISGRIITLRCDCAHFCDDETGLTQARVSRSRALLHDKHPSLSLGSKCREEPVLGTEPAICP